MAPLDELLHPASPGKLASDHDHWFGGPSERAVRGKGRTGVAAPPPLDPAGPSRNHPASAFRLATGKAWGLDHWAAGPREGQALVACRLLFYPIQEAQQPPLIRLGRFAEG